MVKPSKAFVPQAEDISASSREIFQVGSLFASLLSKRETDRILKFGLQSTVGRIPIKTYFFSRKFKFLKHLQKILYFGAKIHISM